MTDTPAVARKRCELGGCNTRVTAPRRRFCDPHRNRPWYEFQIARARAGLTTEAIAARAGMTGSYLAQLSSGQSSPQPYHVEAVADALGVELGDLTPHAATVIPADEPTDTATAR